MKNRNCKGCETLFKPRAPGNWHCSDLCFMATHVDMNSPNGCWEWKGPFNNKDSYGVFDFNKTTAYAHRRVYQLFKGPIPEGLMIRHKCNNRPCVNPDHLLTGTALENKQDSIIAGTIALGERVGGSKLKNYQVLDIYGSNANGPELAKKHGVSKSLIYDIKNGRVWSHLTRNSGITRQSCKRN